MSFCTKVLEHAKVALKFQAITEQSSRKILGGYFLSFRSKLAEVFDTNSD